MPCYNPLQAWRGPVGDSGKRQIVFKRSACKVPGSEMALPCGQCIGCRLERSRQWAMRCVHESELYERSCFVTLTYNDTYLPKDGSVDVREFQLFMKRLRKAYPEDRIRFFHCGEYGEVCKVCGKSEMFCKLQKDHVFDPTLGRPHYHACLFNFDFDDKVLYKVKNGVKLYVSESLMNLWKYGFSTIGDVTFESAAYVARYIAKKITGDKAIEHYEGKDAEYITMSRRPGIGADWYKKYKSDVFPSDFLVVRGVKVKPPKFYDKMFEKEDVIAYEVIKKKRLSGIKHLIPLVDRLGGKSDFVKGATPDRLKDKEYIKRQVIKDLRRSMEETQ